MAIHRRTQFSVLNNDRPRFWDALGLLMLGAHFDPVKCAEAIDRVVGGLGLPSSWFRKEGIFDGGMIVSDEYLYLDLERWAVRARYPISGAAARTEMEAISLLSPAELVQGLSVVAQGAPWFKATVKPAHGAEPVPLAAVAMPFTPDDVPTVGRFFRSTLHTRSRATFEEESAWLSPDVRSTLAAEIEAEETSRWPLPSRPGIYRREHASLLFQSRNGAIVIDPVMLWRGYPNLVNAPFGPTPKLDGVLISHTHSDHYNLPSLLFTARSPDVPVVVPQVPARTVMSREDPAAELHMFGQRVVRAQWWTTVSLGDFTIDVLPFLGEQQTCTGPSACPAFRNWGNCYRINCADYSALVLIDAGIEPGGAMIDVARRSVERRGRPDILLASMPIFLSPFFGGLGEYFLTLPFFRIEELFKQFASQRLESVTPGPDGIAKLCNAIHPRYFATYGNGFSRPGEPITDVSGDGQPSEKECLAALRRGLDPKRARTNLLDWSPGDAVLFEEERATTVPYRDLMEEGSPAARGEVRG